MFYGYKLIASYVYEILCKETKKIILNYNIVLSMRL